MLSEKKLVDNILSIFSLKKKSELAKLLGVAPQIITQWGNGKTKPTLEILSFIVDKTGCSWDEILMGKPTSSDDSVINLQSQLDELKAQVAELRQDKKNMQEHIELLKEKLEGKSENSDLSKISEKAIREALGQRSDNTADSSTA